MKVGVGFGLLFDQPRTRGQCEQFVLDARQRGFEHLRSCHEDDVCLTSQLVAIFSERLAQEPSRSISLDGAANFSAADHAEPQRAFGAGQKKQNHAPADLFPA